MSASPVSARKNMNGRSRSPSPKADSGVQNIHDNSTSVRNNFLNPENSNLYKARHNVSDTDIKRNTFPDSIPLIETKGFNPPPLANPEVDNLGDDKTNEAMPYPSIDDIFFENRANADGPSRNDGVDRPSSQIPLSPTDGYQPRFPEIELGGIPDAESIPDINIYQHKKTLAQGMMDLALFSANANQLRYVLESDQHPYYYSGIVLISISLILQVAIGVGLIWNSRYNVKDDKEICIANKVNNFTIIGIFLVTVVNVFISAFGVASVRTIVTNSP